VLFSSVLTLSITYEDGEALACHAVPEIHQCVMWLTASLLLCAGRIDWHMGDNSASRHVRNSPVTLHNEFSGCLDTGLDGVIFRQLYNSDQICMVHCNMYL